MLATGNQRPRFVEAADHTAVMRRILFPILGALMALPAHAFAQGRASGQEAVIQNALSAAPASVAEHATVANVDGTVLREGTNGWTCMPDMPDVPNESPMCLDKGWLEVIDAWMNKREPDYTGIAIAYMLQGDMPLSNTDPFATGPAAENQWMQDGIPPHHGGHLGPRAAGGVVDRSAQRRPLRDVEGHALRPHHDPDRPEVEVACTLNTHL
jgi:hypothetical protein